MIYDPIEFSLIFEGRESDEHIIDLYDVSRALMGFQRSISLTTHLVLTGEIITQSTALSGARIVTFPSEEGSWKTTALVVGALGTSLYTLGTAPKDTPIGHLVRSAYDYVVNETLGFHVDYEKTLLQQYNETKKSIENLPQLPQSKLDSLIEKCEIALKDIHRPIVESRTAASARISSRTSGGVKEIGSSFTPNTYQYISFTEREVNSLRIFGKVSSYNSNTYKGRIYIDEERRPIPFS